MDVRSPFFSNLALILAGAMFLNPIVATAAQVTVDGNRTQVGAAGNGVPVVNIATPNGNGLSHNTFKDYNVGKQGLILNNSTNRTQETQLGGIIVGNSNLNGKAASMILNEVTGSNRSQLQGYTEVAGQAARVIVANPHGITCDGCGFINTPHATLTTGKPVLDNGRLSHFDVNGGDIAIEGAGINAGNMDQFDLITRSAKINAEIHANELNVITGRNQVDATSLKATAKADDGSDKPKLAIDSSALGGMYAGAIRLVGTESGVGVKLAGDLAASGGDIQIDANGQLTLAQTAAQKDINITARQVELTDKVYAQGQANVKASGTLSNQQSLAAAQQVTVQAGTLNNSGIIEAGVNANNTRNTQADLKIAAQTVNNTGTLIGNRNLQVNATTALNNQGTLSGKSAASIDATTLNNRGGQILANTQLDVKATTLNNSADGLINSAQTLKVQAGQINNQGGELSAKGGVTVTASTLNNQQGRVIAEKGLQVTTTGAVDNRGGTLAAKEALTLNSGSLNNSADGLVNAGTNLNLKTGALNNQGGELSAKGQVNVTATSLNNQQGSLIAEKGLQVTTTGAVDNRGGTIAAKEAVTLSTGSLDNSADGLVNAGQNLQVRTGALNNQAGELSARGQVNITASTLNNQQGRVIAEKDLLLNVQQSLVNLGGTLAAKTSLTLNSGSLNNDDGLINAVQALNLKTGTLSNQRGEISAQGSLLLDAGSLDNRKGLVLSEQDLRLLVAQAVDNRGGILAANRNLNLASTSLNNSTDGLINAGQNLQLQTGALNNQGGELSAKGAVAVNAASLDNQQGNLIAEKGLQLSTTGAVDNRGGTLAARESITLNSGSLDNSADGLVNAGTALDLKTGTLNNQGGEVSAKGQVNVTAATLNNQQGRVIAEKGLQLDATQTDNRGGTIAARELLTIAGTSLDNSADGLINAGQDLQLQVASLINLAGEISAAGLLSVTGENLDNRGGLLVSGSNLQLTVSDTLDNSAAGTISAGADLNVDAGTVNNSNDGLLVSQADMQLTVEQLGNRMGLLISKGMLAATVDSLDNRGGAISAETGLNLSASTVDNRDKGLITSNTDLQLTADSLDSSQGGEVSAGGDLQLNLQQLTQQQGRLISDGALTLNLNNGALDNRGGLISAQGPLSLEALASLDNRGGEISSPLAFALQAARIDNSDGGLIISRDRLTLNAETLLNRNKGLISGWQGVSITGQNLDNSALGTVSSSEGTLGVNLTGALNNSGEGALVSKGNLTVNAASLDNSAGGILSTDNDLDLQLNTLNNQQGLISAAGNLIASATTLNNAGGQLTAADVTLTAQALDNSAGQIIASDSLTLDVSNTLTNKAGGQIAAGKQVEISADTIDNQGGTLASQGGMNLVARLLNNSNSGTVAVRDALKLSVSNLNNSRDGLIYSQNGAVVIEADTFDNTSGVVQAQNGLDLNITGALNNQQGKLLAQQGDLIVQANSLNNQSGIINGFAGKLGLTIAGLLDNTSGTLQGQTLQVSSADLNNTSGHLSALSGDAEILAEAINNEDGGLYAKQLLKITARNLSNLRGQVAARNIDFSLAGALNNQSGIIESNAGLQLVAASIDNRQGALRALSASAGDMVIRSTGLLNNNQGLIETATQNLQLNLGSFSNAGGRVIHVGTGSFGLASALAVQAGGDLLTNGDFTLSASNWTHSGTLQARNLILNVGTFNQTAEGKLLATRNLTAAGGNWTNQGLIASDGVLNLNLTGSYQGDGQLLSLGDLTLKAGNLTLGESTRITGGGLTDITVSNELLNRGVLTSLDDFTLRAAVINNYGTLGGAEQLKLYAPTLHNENGLIFSGADMALRVNTLSNVRGDIYSLGGLSIAGDDSGRWMSRLENLSGTIESAGNMSILASVLENRRDNFETELQRVSGSFDVYWDDVCDGKGCELYFRAVENYEDVIVGDADSPTAVINSGGNFRFTGSALNNLYSSISAAGNIDIDSDTLRNIGMGGGEERHVSSGYYTRDRSAYSAFMNAVSQFNRYNDPDSPEFAPTMMGIDDVLASTASAADGAYFDKSSYVVPTSGGVVAPAIIQAGGAVNISARETLENSVVRDYVAGLGKITDRDTSVHGQSQTQQVVITSQLPPDLQQKQVNPLTLPGFTLPTGEHGLFRLSNQGSSSAGPGGVQNVNLPSVGQGVELNEQGHPVNGYSGQGTSSSSGTVGVNVGSSALIGAIDQVQSQALALSTQGNSSGHKYLIETNPELTNLKQFMSSDYLLDQLGYNPDEAQKRLGDGLYEQRLIREAVMARTGQRYINGINSDEELFRYLMNNAIAYKDELGLSLGVSLTADQIAALTHDIVWLEEYEVMGEKVLVPVVYLAQAEGRLAGNGALIMGTDVNLISGGDLSNQGTLRATNNLSATAENIHNSGLVEASNRLELLANNSIINSAGGIISGRDISLGALTGDIINERTRTTVEARGGNDYIRDDIVNNASRIEARGDLSLRAGRDVSNIGSVIEAGGSARISAGRDLVTASQVEEDLYTYQRRRETGFESRTTQHESVISAGGDLSLSAGRDIAIVASDVSAGDNLQARAGGDLLIASAADEYHQFSDRKKGDTRTVRQNDTVDQRGSTLTAGGDLTLVAGNDLGVSGSSIEAKDEAYLYAGRDVSLSSAEESGYSYFSQTTRKKSLTSSTTKSAMEMNGYTDQQGASVTGDTVNIVAGRDIAISGSDVVSTRETNLLAGRDVTITGATETEQHDAAKSKKKSGLMSSGGIGFTIGSSSVKSTQDTTQEFNRESNVASILGDVNIQAGQTLTVKGSDILAGQDINLTGQDVNILAAENTNRSESTHESKKSGVTLALSGAVGSALNTTYQNAREARKEDDSRISALQGMKAGLSGYQAWQAAEAGGGITAANAGEFFGVAVSLGSQKSSSRESMEQTVSQGSSIQAGNNLNILATGKNGQGGDITVRGSQLQSGNDTLLVANQDINLEAAANRQKLDGSNKSSGGNIGASIGFGSGGGGIGIFANANTSTGKEKGTGTTWAETTLDAGGTTTLVSGRDTTLQGAQVNADKIIASIGRDLTLESLQDSDDYDYKQSSASAGGSFYFGSMTGSGYVSASKDKIKSEYDSVQEQTGLFAGKGGYQIDVGNHTQLDGAVIASTADADKNRLSTGTLGWSDIGNKAEYSSSTANISASTGGEEGGNKFFGNMAGGVGAAGNRGDSASSTTYSAVSEGTVEIRNPDEQSQEVADLRRDTENTANSLSPIFDKEKEQKRLQEIRLIGEVGQQAMDVVRTHAEIEATRRGKEELEAQGTYEPGPEATAKQRKEYKDALEATAGYNSAMDQFGMGSDWQQATQAVTAALQGLAGGGFDAAASGAAAPYLATIIKDMTGENTTANLMAHAVLGAVVAEMQGNSAAAGAAGAVAGESIAMMIAEQVYNKKPGELDEKEKQIVANLAMLASGLAGGLAGEGATDVAAGAGAGKNAVENNLLSNKYGVEKLNEADKALYEKLEPYIGSIDDLQEAFTKCQTGECKSALRDEYFKREAEAGQNLLDLYSRGELTEAEYHNLVTSYGKAMLAGIAEGQRSENGNGGLLGDIYTLSGMDWTPMGIISDPYLSQMRTLALASELSSQGMTGAEIEEKLFKDNVIGGMLAPVDRNALVQVFDSGLSKEQMLQAATMLVVGKAMAGKGGAPKGTGSMISHAADDIRFSQNTVSFNKTDRVTGTNYTYNDLVQSMKTSGWKGDPVDVVKMPDGKLTSMDNTRIAAAREAGIEVKANVRGFDDKLTASEIQRFAKPEKGFNPQTWGEAITGRINNQSGGFAKGNPYGSSEIPRITGER